MCCCAQGTELAFTWRNEDFSLVSIDVHLLGLTMFFKLFNHYIFRLHSCYIYVFNQTLYQMICNKKCRINSRLHRRSTSGILLSDRVGATTFFSCVGMLDGEILSISEGMVVTTNARTPGVSGDMSDKLWSWSMCDCDATLSLLEKWTVYAL